MTYGSLGPDPNPNDISGNISIELIELKVKPLILKCKQCVYQFRCCMVQEPYGEREVYFMLYFLFFFKILLYFEHIVLSVTQNFLGRS